VKGEGAWESIGLGFECTGVIMKFLGRWVLRFAIEWGFSAGESLMRVW